LSLGVPVLGEIFDALPETDIDDCLDALEAGDYLHASFMCPAGTFLSALTLGLTGPDDEDDDEDEEDDQ